MPFFRYSFMLLCFASSLVLFSNVKAGMIKVNLSRFFQAQISPQTTATNSNTNANSSQLVVDLSDRRVYLYQSQKLVAGYPVAVGKKDWQTPVGQFKVLEKKRHPAWIQPLTGEVIPAGPNNPLGDRWIGFWSDGVHKIGFHGTNKEKSVGGAVSHGCLRMRNDDIRNIYTQVNMGTTVIVKH
jgi:L,D-transpeptidase ErfK/SrfK